VSDQGFSVLMVKTTEGEVNCPRCTSGLIVGGGRVPQAMARRELEKVYRGWHCGCRRTPENSIVVHVQGPDLQYLQLCAGCASELTGVPKSEIMLRVSRNSAKSPLPA
jgi:ribosomal protein L34E